MKKILVISWFYPPINSSEGLVTYKLLKASNYEYTVFTQNSNDLWSYSKTDTLPQSNNVSVHFSKADTLESWQNEAVEFYRSHSNDFDIVMTRSMPPESHKVGLEIKQINPSIKWIASFGDPIANNPYTKIALSQPSPYSYKNCRNLLGIISPKRLIRSVLFNRYLRKQKHLLKKESKFQNSIIETANVMIMNSSYQKEYMLKDYPENITNKAVVLYHSFDETLYPKKTTSQPGKTKMVYVGHLDDIRSPKLFLEAVNELNEADPNLKDKLEISFYGHISDNDKLYVINNQLTDIVKVRKSVSYLDSLKIMTECDWLLQIDANISSAVEKNIFFAAKLADYIGTGNKIFGITMYNGISAEIMRNLKAVVASHSKEEIKNYLWLILYNDFESYVNMEYRNEFNSATVAEKFDKLISDLNN